MREQDLVRDDGLVQLVRRAFVRHANVYRGFTKDAFDLASTRTSDLRGDA